MRPNRVSIAIFLLMLGAIPSFAAPSPSPSPTPKNFNLRAKFIEMPGAFSARLAVDASKTTVIPDLQTRSYPCVAEDPTVKCTDFVYNLAPNTTRAFYYCATNTFGEYCSAPLNLSVPGALSMPNLVIEFVLRVTPP